MASKEKYSGKTEEEIQTVQFHDVEELWFWFIDSRYWREKDPSFISKVTDGFQNMYGK